MNRAAEREKNWRGRKRGSSSFSFFLLLNRKIKKAVLGWDLPSTKSTADGDRISRETDLLSSNFLLPSPMFPTNILNEGSVIARRHHHGCCSGNKKEQRCNRGNGTVCHALPFAKPCLRTQRPGRALGSRHSAPSESLGMLHVVQCPDHQALTNSGRTRTRAGGPSSPPSAPPNYIPFIFTSPMCRSVHCMMICDAWFPRLF